MTLAGSFQGMAFGPGSSIHVAGVSGLEDLPSVRSADVPRAAGHGSYRGRDLLSERTIVMKFVMFADTPAAYRTLRRALAAATVPLNSESPLYLLDNTQLIYVRPRRRQLPYDAEFDRRAGEATVEFVATDPRIYDATLTSVTKGVAAASGGFTFPITFPLTFGVSTAGSGTFQVNNIGNFNTRPSVRITGPVDNPRLEHTDQGKIIQLAISLGATDYVDIDFATRNIILNGTASRRSTLTPSSQWWDLQPGINNIRYAANSLATGSTATLTFRSAWV